MSCRTLDTADRTECECGTAFPMQLQKAATEHACRCGLAYRVVAQVDLDGDPVVDADGRQFVRLRALPVPEPPRCDHCGGPDHGGAMCPEAFP